MRVCLCGCVRARLPNVLGLCSYSFRSAVLVFRWNGNRKWALRPVACWMKYNTIQFIPPSPTEKVIAHISHIHILKTISVALREK